MKKLNLGCGRDIKKGYINLDIIKSKGVDIVHNLNKFPYPFKNEEFDEVFSSHLLEHLLDFKKTIFEIHRITKRRGRIKLIVPHFSNRSAYSPFHKSYFNSRVFKIFEKEKYDYSLDHKYLFNKYEYKFVFAKGKQFWNWLIEPLANMFPELYESTGLCYLFPCLELRIKLMK